MKKCSKLSNITNINHGFFTRKGGTSTGIYESLNCGPGSKDEKENVKRNREIVAEKLEVPHDKLFTLYQCHTNEVVILDNLENFNPKIEADALVTNQKGAAIGILTADCAPVLLSNKDGTIVGAAHAGWNGAISGILENTVAAMYDLGANHDEITATIGPCISGDSYEVGEEYRDNFLDDDPDNHKFFKMLSSPGKFLFNLPGYATARLESLGLGSVKWIGEDTLSNEQEFFSYRRSCINNEPDYGRQVSAIAIKDKLL